MKNIDVKEAAFVMEPGDRFHGGTHWATIGQRLDQRRVSHGRGWSAALTTSSHAPAGYRS